MSGTRRKPLFFSLSGAWFGTKLCDGNWLVKIDSIPPLFQLSLLGFNNWEV